MTVDLDALEKRLLILANAHDWKNGSIHNAEMKALALDSYAAVAELKEAYRRRDAWRDKAEGYDALRLALREKVGAPWPPNLSRALWAGIAADEKRRADDAERELKEARGLLKPLADCEIIEPDTPLPDTDIARYHFTMGEIRSARAFLAKAQGGE